MLWALLLCFLAIVALRLLFIAVHLNHLESLWYDFERRGLKYQFCWSFDALSNGGYTLLLVIAMWRIQEQSAPLLCCFVGFFASSLLGRLPLHAFPRTNIPGAMADAQAELISRILVSLLGGAIATAATAAYLMWTGSM